MKERLSSLDGLRGVAAVIVLVHHALLTFPSLAAAYYGQGAKDPLAWVLSYTPLHMLWAGTEAVYLFFVLSGIVLVLPAIRAGKRFSWPAYYPRRILRLYLPVGAAVVFGAFLVVLVTRHQELGLGSWINSREPRYSVEGFARDLVLIFGPSRVISPLWSLRWEVIFSLLLPLYVVFAVRVSSLWWIKLCVLLTMITAGALVDSPYLFFLPIFGVGALLVAEWDRIATIAHHLDTVKWAWPVVLVVAALLSTVTWTIATPRADWLEACLSVVPVLGVTLFVLAAAFYGRLRSLLETRIITWLGAISFALYLVHEPIIIAARFVTYPLSPWIGLAIALPVSFAVAWAFARFIEQPAHRLSKRAGKFVDSLFSRRAPHPDGVTVSPER